MDDQSKNGINFGHGAAINGAFSVDSHNTTIHQAQKSAGELDIEKRKLFKQQCEMLLKDGRIDALEARTLEQFRRSIGLDKDVAADILNDAKNISSMSRGVELGPIQRMTLNQVVSLAKAEKITLLQGSLPRLEAILQTTPVAEVSFHFNMISAALQTECLIARYENRVSDDYWQSYWAYIAYFNAGESGKAESVLAELGKWQEYPFGNIALLASIGLLYQYRLDQTLLDFKEQADAYLNQSPDDHSEYLEPLAQILIALLNEDEQSLNVLESEYPFYFHQLVPKLIRISEQKTGFSQSQEDKQKKLEQETEALVDETDVSDHAAEDIEQDTHCSVYLSDCGSSPRDIVQAICEISSMNKEQACHLIEHVPCIVLENIDREDAEEFVLILNSNGGKCELVSPKQRIKREPVKVDFGGMFSKRLEQLMSTILEDGVLSAKDKELIIKRAKKENEDIDEVLMVLESKMTELGIVDDSE